MNNETDAEKDPQMPGGQERVRGLAPPWVRVRNHPGEGPADKWTIADLTVKGTGPVKIGLQLNRSPEAIRGAARGMGFLRVNTGGGGNSDNRAPIYNFGDVFDPSTVRCLKCTLDFSTARLAKSAGVKQKQLEKALRPRSKQVSSGTARKIIAWRDGQVIPQLLSSAPKRQGAEKHSYGPRRILKTFFPNLHEKYSLLIEALGHLRRWLNERPNRSINDLKQHLCEQAMLETAGELRGKLFTHFLRWAPELMPFLEVNFVRLRGDRGLRPRILALEAIASYWGTTAETVNQVVRLKVDAIPPGEMHWLIKRLAQSRKSQTDSDGTIAPKLAGAPAKKRELFLQAAELYKQLGSWGKVARKLVPDEFLTNSRGAAERLRLGAQYHLQQARFQTLSQKI
jgi:hypothetical protein